MSEQGEEPEGPTTPRPPLPPIYDPATRQLVCAIETDTRDNIDPKLFYDKIAEFEGVKVLDKADVCGWYTGLNEPHSAALRDQMDSRSEHAWDGELVAAAFAHRLAAVHQEIVQEKKEDLEDAMIVWEEAGDPNAPLPTVPEEQLYVFFKGFPMTIEHVRSLQAVGVPLHVVACVNSPVPLVVPTEEREDPGKAGKGKGGKDAKKDKGKKDDKKPDPKKGKDKGGKKGKGDDDDEPPPPTTSLSEELRPVVAELNGKHIQDELRDILVVHHTMKVEKEEEDEDDPSAVPVLYLVEDADDVLDILYAKIKVVAARRLEYDQWAVDKKVVEVPTLEEFFKLDRLRVALHEKEEEIAKLEDQIVAAGGDGKGDGKGKADKGGKKRPETPADKGGKDKGGKKDKATLEREKEMEALQDKLQGLMDDAAARRREIEEMPPVTAANLTATKDYYQTLIEQVPSSRLSIPVVAHCLVEQTVKTLDTEKQVNIYNITCTNPSTATGTPMPAATPLPPPSTGGGTTTGNTAVGTAVPSASPTPEPDADLLFGSGGTLKVNAIEAESMKAEPQVDITPALTDYLDMVLSRLDGTSDQVQQELLQTARKKELEQRGDPLTPTLQCQDLAQDMQSLRILSHGDHISMQHLGGHEPLVTGLGVKDLTLRGLQAVMSLPQFNKLADPEALKAAPPVRPASAEVVVSAEAALVPAADASEAPASTAAAEAPSVTPTEAPAKVDAKPRRQLFRQPSHRSSRDF
uniref:Uncharacterized protein n=1 Tax=Eutreptiella gymnastica TaxID=73025 RepID=A0A7S4LCZ3_9EUGL